MGRPLQQLQQFLRELKRRNVYRVAVTYAVVGFVLVQVADLTFVRLGLPSWSVTFVIVLVAMGFPLALVLAWAFERTPRGVRRTPEPGPVDEEVETGSGLRTGYKMLVALGLAAAAVAGGWYLTGGGGETPEPAGRTVVVFPFEVTGSGTDAWRDGMITMLNTGLDGAAGLRAISARTVLAAWEEREGAEGAAREPIAVARTLGARYAIDGSAGQVGEELRLTASVHQVASGERIDRVAVRGSPDSVISLADDLARGVLGVLLEESGDAIPSVNLRRLTTADTEALKQYVAGERHFRAGDYEAAIEDFQAAVRSDSAFALAYARLALSRAWIGASSLREWSRAHSLSDRLRPRERRLVRAGYLNRVRFRSLAAADTLRRMTEAYPDDPAVWYSLGETIFHGRIPGGWPEAEDAFERAVELDPGVAPYQRHLVEIAFSLHHDSVLAAERSAAYPAGPERQVFQLIWQLFFGPDDARAGAFSRLDTVQLPEAGVPNYAVLHPSDLGLAERMYRRVRRREDVDDRLINTGLARVEGYRGQLEDAMQVVREGELPRVQREFFLSVWMSMDLPVPDSLLRRYLDLSAEGSDPLAGGRCWACVGMYLVERGSPEDVDRLLSRIRDQTAAGALGLRSLPGFIRGYRAREAGDLRRALESWSGQGPPNVYYALWRAGLYREHGDLTSAEDWYLAAREHPIANERLGQLYEEMGEREKAADAYRRFVTAWAEADEALQPRVRRARERLEALRRSFREPS